MHSLSFIVLFPGMRASRWRTCWEALIEDGWEKASVVALFFFFFSFFYVLKNDGINVPGMPFRWKTVWDGRMEGRGCTYETMDLLWFIISFYLTWLCTVWSLFPKGFEKMRNTHSSLDHDVKSLVCSLARDDGNLYEEIPFILSINNSQICIFTHYPRSHIGLCVHKINNYS